MNSHAVARWPVAACALSILLAANRSTVAAPLVPRDGSLPLRFSYTLEFGLGGRVDAPAGDVTRPGVVVPVAQNVASSAAELSLTLAGSLSSPQSPNRPAPFVPPAQVAILSGRSVRVDATQLAPRPDGPIAAVAVDGDDALDTDAGVVVPAVTFGGNPTSGAPAAPKARPQPAERPWALAPVEWRGQLGTSLGWSQSTGALASTSRGETLALTANSYIWQPWFAKINGSFSVNRAVVGNGRESPTIMSVSGGGGLDLFPVSRFPFSTNYNVTSSSVSGAAAGSDIVFQRLALNQGYRPPDNAYMANGGYEWSQFDGVQTGVDTINRFSGNFSKPVQSENPQNYTANGSHTINTNSRGTSGSVFTNLQGNHSINVVDYGLLVNSDTYFTQNQLTSAGTTNQSQTFQVGTAADWIPDDDVPLRVFGNARYNQQTAGAGKATSLVLGSSATYTQSRNWRFGANANVFSSKFFGQQVTTIVGGANAGWTGDGVNRQFGDWFYTLGYGASGGVNIVSGGLFGGASTTLGSTVGQGLSRVLDVGLGTPVALALSQSYGASVIESAGVSQTLSHSATANWAFSQGADYNLSSSVSAQDSRSFGVSESEFQAVTATANGNLVLSPYSSATAYLNAGLSRQGVSAQSGVASQQADWIGTASGSIGYRHGRFMRVPGLIYDAMYTVNYRPGSSRLLGDPSAAASGFNLDHIFRQQWQWRIGQLGLTVSNTFTATAGTRSASIFFFATRDFGGVL